MPTLETFESYLKNTTLSLKRMGNLAPYSTMRVGGKARFLIEIAQSRDLESAVIAASRFQVPYMVVGKGSNIIFSDAFFDGLIIINMSKKWHISDERISTKDDPATESRFKSLEFDSTRKIRDHEQVLSDSDVIIIADSGVMVNYLSQMLYKESITGLEWYTGIPATVGGAIYMNMHGGDYYFGELLESAVITDGKAKKKVDADYFQFGYDWSILHETKEIVLEANLRLHRGDVKAAQDAARNWAIYKSQQPKRSAGCIFKNLTAAEQLKLGLPTPSIGYVIDKVLNLKGVQIGDAIISDNHAAFIENLGQATAADVYALMQLIKQKAKKDLNLDLKEEIQLVGKF
jgi:UDP-N-acetylmuramate dehydrogenase